jgi:hypothetical protein
MSWSELLKLLSGNGLPSTSILRVKPEQRFLQLMSSVLATRYCLKKQIC